MLMDKIKYIKNIVVLRSKYDDVCDRLAYRELEVDRLKEYELKYNDAQDRLTIYDFDLNKANNKIVIHSAMGFVFGVLLGLFGCLAYLNYAN